MGSGPSPPTKPLANSLNDVDDLTEDEGANAEAVAARVAAKIADFILINSCIVCLCSKSDLK